jgi:hypothetical protein
MAESRAVRDGGLRPIGDRGGTPRTHVTAGESRALAGLRLGAIYSGRAPRPLRLSNRGHGSHRGLLNKTGI